MRAASVQPSFEADRPSLRRRGTAIVLTILAHVLLLLLLLRLAPEQFRMAKENDLVTISVSTENGDAQKRAAAAPKAKRTQRAATPKPSPSSPPPPPPPPSPVPPINIVPLTRQDMAAGDIGRLHSQHADAGDAAGTAVGSADGDSATVGTGPGGQSLYAAEWQREPTQAELSFYLKDAAHQAGYALIACETVARYHVDNCVPLAESPVGSGLMRGVLNAAWQFLVRPPRVNGRSMVGAWVRIRIEYSERAGK